MGVTTNNSTLTSALKNEVDFLVFLGLSTGIILRYVRTSRQLDDSSLAGLLGITSEDLRNLEKSTGYLPNDWHRNLRALFEN
jgi:hypothetical protein